MNYDRSENEATHNGRAKSDEDLQAHHAAKRVSMTIESMQGDEPFTQRVHALMYQKDGSTIYRYEESASEMGKTTTTVKVNTGRSGRLATGHPEISIIRHGEVRSVQKFIRNQTTNGYLQLPQGRMLLRMETTAVDIHVDEGLGSIRWQYRLYTDDYLAGMYQVKLNIQEEANE